jgi:signal transduction histidine kinase
MKIRADNDKMLALGVLIVIRFLLTIWIVTLGYTLYSLWQGNYKFSIINSIAFLVNFLGFYLIKFKKLYHPTIIPLIIFNFLLIFVSLMLSYGLYSYGMVSIYLLFFITTLIFPTPKSYYLLAFYSLCLLGLIYVQATNPEWLKPYIPQKLSFANLLITFATDNFLYISIGLIISQEYIKEQSLILKREHILAKQNKSIILQNQEIESYNEGINYLNQQLELLVEERTNQLEKQNQQLLHYAFYNAHKVRAPLARILGLIQLLNMENQLSKEMNKFYLQSINDNIKELERVVKNIHQQPTEDSQII